MELTTEQLDKLILPRLAKIAGVSEDELESHPMYINSFRSFAYEYNAGELELVQIVHVNLPTFIAFTNATVVAKLTDSDHGTFEYDVSFPEDSGFSFYEEDTDTFVRQKKFSHLTSFNLRIPEGDVIYFGVNFHRSNKEVN